MKHDGYDKENEHTAEQLFTLTCSGRTGTTYKRVDYLY